MPCDYSKYPKDWKQIRARILERDGHRCKFCGVANGAIRAGDQVVSGDTDAAFQAGEMWAVGEGPKPIKIVLTVAHVENPDPMDCRDENLAALCQRCHLRHDAKQHAVNARSTRNRKKGQEALVI